MRIIAPTACCIVTLACAHGSSAVGHGRSDEVPAALEAATREHPRLFMSAAEAQTLAERAKANPTTEKNAALIIRRAEQGLDADLPRRQLKGRRLLGVSRDVSHRLVALAMAWHLTGDQRFVERASRDLNAIAGFKNWNPSHFLDTAEMTFGAAVAYDWLYHQLDAETRQRTRTAILEKGLRAGLASDDHWWIRTSNNWNQVCHGGLVAGALAIFPEHPEPARRTIARAVRFVPNAMKHYSPHGAYPEGPGYWSYGTSFNVLMLAMFESTLGTTFELEKAPGFDQTGAFPALVTGPSGHTFNYADGGSNRSFQPAIYWLSNRFSQPGWTAHEDQFLEPDVTTDNHPADRWMLPFALLWHQDPGNAHANFPKHWQSGGHVPISIHRENWKNPNASFVGFKAGSPDVSHGQMDIGSFVFDANGIRWAHDLGSESYHRIESRNMDLWDYTQNADRWKVFRQNSFSHNTLVIDHTLQRARAHARMVQFSDQPAFPHSVADLSPIYTPHAKSVHRGIAMLPNGVVLVRDALRGLKPDTIVNWNMVTRAQLKSINGPILTLEQDGHSLDLSLANHADASWKFTDIEAPKNAWDSPNKNASMVTLTTRAPTGGTLDLVIILRPTDRPKPSLTKKHRAHPLQWSP